MTQPNLRVVDSKYQSSDGKPPESEAEAISMILERSYYVRNNPDLADIDLSDHFANYGSREGRSGASVSHLVKIPWRDLAAMPARSATINSAIVEALVASDQIDTALEYATSSLELHPRAVHRLSAQLFSSGRKAEALSFLSGCAKRGDPFSSIYFDTSVLAADIATYAAMTGENDLAKDLYTRFLGLPAFPMDLSVTLDIAGAIDRSPALASLSASEVMQVLQRAISNSDFPFILAGVARMRLLRPLKGREMASFLAGHTHLLSIDIVSNPRILEYLEPLLLLLESVCSDREQRASACAAVVSACEWSYVHQSRDATLRMVRTAAPIFSDRAAIFRAIEIAIEISNYADGQNTLTVEDIISRAGEVELMPGSDKSWQARSFLASRLQELGYTFGCQERFREAAALYKAASRHGVANLTELDDVVRSMVVSSGMEVGRTVDLVEFKDVMHASNAFPEGRISELPIISGLVHAAKNRAASHVVYKSRTGTPPRLKFSGPQVSSTVQPGSLDYPALYAAEVRDVLAVSNCNPLKTASGLVYDKLQNVHATDAVFGDLVGSPRMPMVLAHDSKTAIVFLPDMPRERHQVGIAMFGVQAHNYGHWFIEYLPRMLAFNAMDIPADVPIFINTGLPTQIRQSLDVLNFRRHPVKELKPGVACDFDKLYISAPPAYFPLDVKNGAPVYDTVWPSDVFAKLREEVIRGCGLSAEPTVARKRRVYISGTNQHSRRLVNDDEIEAYLVERGFEVARPETLSFAEQVKLFQSASIVVGVCKSSLSNALFCEPGTPVIGMCNDTPNFNFNGYASYIEASGARVHFIRGTAVAFPSVHPYHRDFRISLPDLKQALEDSWREHLEFMFAPAAARKTLTSELARVCAIAGVSPSAAQKIAEAVKKSPGALAEAIEKADLKPPLFDADAYLKKLYAEVSEPGFALLHYLLIGSEEGAATSVGFDSRFYLERNTDVRNARANPWLHYLEHGVFEGRIGIDLGAVESDRRFEQEVEARPLDSHLINVYLAYLLWAERFREAETHFAATKDHPGRFQTILCAGYLLEEEGRLEGAQKVYELVLRHGKEYGNIYFYLGNLNRRLGRMGLAHRYYMRGLEIEPEHTPLKHCLEYAIEHEQTMQADDRYESSLLDSLANKAKADSIDYLLFDTSFPDPISSFRFGEFDAYLRSLPNAIVYSSNWDVRGHGGESNFGRMIANFGGPEGRVRPFDSRQRLRASAGYAVFLNNAVVLSDRSAIDVERFGFTLYPGGGYVIGRRAADDKLRRVLDNNRLAYVVTTQNLAYKHLVDVLKFPADRVVHIFGGVVPRLLIPKPSRRVRSRDKKTLDVCFVAQRYTARGTEKGYDVFVDVAKALKDNDQFAFHVVGSFTPDVIDLGGASNITFYGAQRPEFFETFYPKMDIILSPNISGYELEGQGQFDGFPTTAVVEAAGRDVAMFLSDSLGLNARLDGRPLLEPGRDFERIDRNAEDIVARLLKYSQNRERLALLGESGRRALERLYSWGSQIEPRLAALRRLVQ